MTNECLELENIKYQTMLLNGSANIKSNVENTINIDSILEKEMKNNKKNSWNKLGNSEKVFLFKQFAIEYCSKNNLNDTIKDNLISYFLKCLERKKLNKIKDVNYDTETQRIRSIPNLIFDSSKQKFTLKVNDRKKTHKKQSKK